MPDKELKCKDCGAMFILSESDQQYIQSKGYHEPKRCLACRKAKRERMKGEAPRS